MASITITFHGLVFFAHRGAKQTDALCHPEGGAHIPVLSVPVKQVEIGANEWQPDVVTYDSAGEEIAVWNISDQAFELGVGNEDRGWRGDVRGLRMRDFHPAARPVGEAEADRVLFDTRGKGARIRLHAGTFRFEASPSIRVRVRQNGQEGEATDYSSAVSWEGSLDDPKGAQIRLPVNRAGQAIKLRRLDGVNLRVTNVARIAFPDGLQHFDCYYDLLENVPAPARIALIAARLDAEIYDCIPPTDG